MYIFRRLQQSFGYRLINNNPTDFLYPVGVSGYYVLNKWYQSIDIMFLINGIFSNGNLTGCFYPTLTVFILVVTGFNWLNLPYINPMKKYNNALLILTRRNLTILK